MGKQGIKQMPKRSSVFLKLVVIFATVLFPLLPMTTSALMFTDRSVTTSTSIPSASASYTFQLTYPSTSNVGSLVFAFCNNNAIIDQPCNAPPGLNLSSVVLSGQTGNTGFSINAVASTANKIVLTRPAAAGLTVPSTYSFSGAINPSEINHTVYVRISSYPTADGTGPYSDNGSVAFSTTSQFSVNVQVPPFLQLCVAVVVAPDCSSSAGNSIDLGILSSQTTRFATTELAAGTNSATGYSLFVMGTTMTSGNNSIAAINPAGSSQIGNSQFGINLRANSNPPVGQEPSGGGTGTPQAGYDTPNQFKLQSGDMIAASSLPSDYNKLTVSYVVNVSPTQPAGTYSTTLSYLATAQF